MNVDGVGIVLAGSGDTLALHVITKLVDLFALRHGGEQKTSLSCPCTLVPCKCSEAILKHNKTYSENDLRLTKSVPRLFLSIKKYSKNDLRQTKALTPCKCSEAILKHKKVF